jgi:hypothetical protein
MPFDLATAKPVTSGGFDLKTAKPVVAPQADPTAGMSTFDKIAAGAGSAITDLGLGLKQRLDEGAAYLERKLGGESVNKALGLRNANDILADTNTAVAQKRALDAPLVSSGAGRIGAFGGKVLAAIPASFIPGGQTLAGSAISGAVLGAAEPTIDGESALKNAAIGATGGAVGYGVGKGIGTVASKVGQRLAAKGAQNQMLDDAIAAARDAGYAIPPSQSNPSSIVANVLDIATGGRPKMAQAAALKNQGVTNQLAAKALGLPESTPLNNGVLEQVRRDAFTNGYAPVHSVGDVTPGPAYAQALDSIEQASKGASRSFPNAVKNEIPGMVDSLRVGKFDAGDGLQMSQILRDAATKAYTSGDRALGKANRDASKAIEDAIEEHLQSAGMPDALAAFRDARKLIAKTYTVQKGLNDTTGNVSAKAIASQLKKGAPLTDELEAIGRAAQLPGNSLRDMMYATPAGSQLESVLSTGGAIASHNPLLVAVPAARSGLRNLMLSDAVQKAIPAQSYQSNLLRALASDPTRIGINAAGVSLPELSKQDALPTR